MRACCQCTSAGSGSDIHAWDSRLSTRHVQDKRLSAHRGSPTVPTQSGSCLVTYLSFKISWNRSQLTESQVLSCSLSLSLCTPRYRSSLRQHQQGHSVLDMATRAPTRLLRRFARYYNANFERRPTPTLMVTNGVLNTIADGLVSRASLELGLELELGCQRHVLCRSTCVIPQVVTLAIIRVSQCCSWLSV
jgi:hypothetical protein